MKSDRNHPGIYVPPPFIYASVFLLAILIQWKLPIDDAILHEMPVKVIGVLIILIAIFFFLFRSLKQFFRTKNTVVTIMPASSLQTTGIYSLTRNPMYVGMTMIYLGLTCLIGNWWNVILSPVLLIIVQEYVIKREEKYLVQRFGQQYLDYKLNVRRWL